MTDKEQSFPIQLRSSIEQRGAEFAAMLDPLDISHERFMRIALLYVTKNPNLWPPKCSKESVFLSIMEAARAGLMIDSKEAALIPYKGIAEFQPMVQGIIRLMLRSPGLVKVEARCVYEGDDFAFNYGIRPRLDHVPSLSPIGDREITHAYAIMWRQGAEPTFEVMGRDELDLVRSKSKSPNSPAYTLYLGEMFRRTVLKRLSKYADLSPEASRAIAIDNAVVGSSWGQDYVDGPSDEYQNLLTKNRTQAGIVDLKERMENGDNQEEKVDPEPKPEPDADSKATPEPEPRAKNKWEPEIVNFLAETQLVDGKDENQIKLHIRKILNRSPFMSVPYGELDVVEATAFVIGRILVMEEYPELESPKRYELLLEWWTDDARRAEMIERAMQMIPPEEPTRE